VVVSFTDQLRCAERELKLRKRVYPRRIEAQRMTQDLADREVRMMEAIVGTLEALAQKERLF
jgi:hypothetical protein